MSPFSHSLYRSRPKLLPWRLAFERDRKGAVFPGHLSKSSGSEVWLRHTEDSWQLDAQPSTQPRCGERAFSQMDIHLLFGLENPALDRSSIDRILFWWINNRRNSLEQRKTKQNKVISKLVVKSSKFCFCGAVLICYCSHSYYSPWHRSYLCWRQWHKVGAGGGAQVCPTRQELTLAHKPSPLCNCPRQDSWVWQNMVLASGHWEKHPDATAMTSCVVRDSLGTGHFL